MRHLCRKSTKRHTLRKATQKAWISFFIWTNDPWTRIHGLDVYLLLSLFPRPMMIRDSYHPLLFASTLFPTYMLFFFFFYFVFSTQISISSIAYLYIILENKIPSRRSQSPQRRWFYTFYSRGDKGRLTHACTRNGKDSRGSCKTRERRGRDRRQARRRNKRHKAKSRGCLEQTKWLSHTWSTSLIYSPHAHSHFLPCFSCLRNGQSTLVHMRPWASARTVGSMTSRLSVKSRCW